MEFKFSWLVALLKGVRDAFLAAVPVIAAAVVVAVFGALGPEQLVTYGVPLWLIPVLIGLFTYIRNFLRNRFGWPV